MAIPGLNLPRAGQRYSGGGPSASFDGLADRMAEVQRKKKKQDEEAQAQAEAAAAKQKADAEAKAKADAEKKKDSLPHKIASGIADIFQADSPADQQKRLAAGQPALYADQQKQQKQTADAFNGSTAEEFKRGSALNLTPDDLAKRRDYYKAAGIDVDRLQRDKAEYDALQQQLGPQGSKNLNKLAELTKAGKVTDGAKRYDAQQEQLRRTEANYQRSQRAAAGAESAPQQVERGLVRGMGAPLAEVPANIETMAGAAVKAVAPGGSRLDRAGEQLYEHGVKDRQALAAKMVTSGYAPQAADNPALRSFSEGAGSLAASLTAAKLFRGASAPAAMFGINQGGDQTVAATQAGKGDVQSAVTGAVGGAFEGLLEKVGLEKFLGAGGGLVRKVATRMLTEGSQEAAQSLAQSGVSATYSHVDLQQAVQQAVTEGGLGALIGGGAGLPLSIAEQLESQGVDHATALETGMNVQERLKSIVQEEQGNDAAPKPETVPAAPETPETGPPAPEVPAPRPAATASGTSSPTSSKPISPSAENGFQPGDSVAFRDIKGGKVVGLQAERWKVISGFDDKLQLEGPDGKTMWTTKASVEKAPEVAADANQGSEPSSGKKTDIERFGLAYTEVRDYTNAFIESVDTGDFERANNIRNRLAELATPNNGELEQRIRKLDKLAEKAKSDAGQRSEASSAAPAADDRPKSTKRGTDVSTRLAAQLQRKGITDTPASDLDALKLLGLTQKDQQQVAGYASHGDWVAAAQKASEAEVRAAEPGMSEEYYQQRGRSNVEFRDAAAQHKYGIGLREVFDIVKGADAGAAARPAASRTAVTADAMASPSSPATKSDFSSQADNAHQAANSTGTQITNKLDSTKYEPVTKSQTQAMQEAGLSEVIVVKGTVGGKYHIAYRQAGDSTGPAVYDKSFDTFPEALTAAVLHDSGRKRLNAHIETATKRADKVADGRDEVLKEAWLVERRQKMGQELDDHDRAVLQRAEEIAAADDAVASSKAMRRNLDKQMGSIGKVVETPTPLTKADRQQVKADSAAEIAANDAELKRRAAARKTAPADPDAELLAEAKKYSSAKEFADHVHGSATQYGNYTPHLRHGGSMPGTKRLTELGVDPEEEVTIYRGIDDRSGTVKRQINDGDFVTADYESALAYTGDPKDVVSMTVKAKDLISEDPAEFADEPFYVGAEFVYSTRHDAPPPRTDAELRAIYDRAHGVRAPVAEDVQTNTRTEAIDALDAVGFASRDDSTVEVLGREDERPAAELIRLADQLNKAAQKGAVLRRGGLKSKKALGAFKRKGDGPKAKDPHIALRDAVMKDPHQYATVLAHELSHATEFYINGNTRQTFKLFGELSDAEKQQINKELHKVVDSIEGPKVAASNPTYYYRPTEMLARYVELRFLHGSKAELIAPLVTEKFDDLVMREPRLQDLIDAIDGKIDKGHVNWTPYHLKDLRQLYRYRLGKAAGDAAYDAEVVRRAEIQRSGKLIDQLVKRKFKGVKDDGAELFRAAEAILVTKDGKPQFGTHDFLWDVKEADLPDAQKAGYTIVEKKPQLTAEQVMAVLQGEDVPESAIKFEYDLARDRYTPAQAEAQFNKLSPEGQQLIRDFTAAKEEAKDEFNRELMKELYHIDSKIEGWVHHYFEGKPLGGNAKASLRHKVAAAKKQRKGAEGYIEDFQKATEKALRELDRNEINNSFIRDQLARISKPIAKGAEPDKGWVEVVADEKGGLRLPGEGMQVIIKPEAGKAVRVPQKRYQVPADLARHYREIRDVPVEVNAAAKALNRLAKYWALNVLVHPGTMSTNFISGGLQYGAKIMDGFYTDLLTADFGMSRTRHNLIAPLQVLMPHGWNNAPDWLYGSYRSNQAGQLANGRYDTKIDRGIDQYGDKMLKAFSLVETYWKKTIALSEGSSLQGASNRRVTDRLSQEEQQMVTAINEVIDQYAFDYDNKPLWLSKFDRHGGKFIKPFMTYPYKLTKFYTGYAAAAFDRSLPWETRVSKVLTLTTIVAAIAMLYHDREEKMTTPKGTEKTPLSLSPSGRVYVKTAQDGREMFIRTAKYPWFNLTSFGRAAADRNGKEVMGLLNEMFGTVGPGFDLFLMATGRSDQFDQYTPVSERLGEMAGSFIPGFRILNDVGQLMDDKSRKPKTFVQGVTSQLPIWGSEEQRTKLRGDVRTIKIPDEPAEGRSIAKSARTVTTREMKVEQSDVLRSLLTGIYLRRIDPKEAKQQQLREIRDDAEAEVRQLLAAGNEADAEVVATEHGLKIPTSVLTYYRTQRKKKDQ